MAKVNYGFSGLNQSLNPQLTNNTNLLNNFTPEIITARVKSIVLEPTGSIYNAEGWNSLGAIQYDPVKSPTPINNFTTYPIAYPLNSNIKSFPLINEIVYIISLPSTGIGENNNIEKNYYINTVSLWNHPHHNAYPLDTNILPPSQNKDYTQTGLGSIRRITDEATEIFLGKTFKERSDIHPLLPFEGDIIYEGRWGNSIRLGSTVKNTPNNWSQSETNGDPITIIRNGQGNQTEEGWIPITENINNDNSSIYLTSTQNIPLQASSTFYNSYVSSSTPPTSPSKYNGSQIILDSGRLLFNAYDDHIMLTSAKTINLNSLLSVNIDTGEFVVAANNIYLGQKGKANQHIMLGDNTVEFLKQLVFSLKDLASTLKTLESDAVINGKPATFTLKLTEPAVTLYNILESLEIQLDNNVLISQNNFTL